MKHIGQEISAILESRNIVKKRFAEEIGTTEANLYKILRKASIDAALLSKIASTLQVPAAYFFDENTVIHPTEIGHRVSGNRNEVKGDIHWATCEDKLEKANLQIKHLQAELDNKNLLIEEKDKMIAEKERLIGVLLKK